MKDNVVVLPRFAPWKNTLKGSPAELVVYPSQRGGFSAQGVPIPDDPKHRLKCRFPESWAGCAPPSWNGCPASAGCAFAMPAAFW